MNIVAILQISLGAIFINNFVLAKMLGICPILNASTKLSSAGGLGLAATFVMTIASAVAWIIDAAIIVPYDVPYLRIIVFILVIASLTQLLEMILQKFSPVLFDGFGIFLPLIATNCAVLAAALMATQENPYTGLTFGFFEACVNGFMSGIGFMAVLIVLTGIREKLEYSAVGKSLAGLPIALITAGLMALAFLGLSGVRIPSATGGF